MARCPDIRCLPLPSYLRSYEGSPQKILLFGHGLNHMVENLYGCSNLAGKSDLTGKLNTFTEVNCICVTDFFWAPAARGTLQDMYREWPTSRFAAV